MNRIESGIHTTNSLSTETHKSFPIHYGLRGKSFNRILTYLYCTKYNEINISYSDIQKHFPIKKSYKKYKYLTDKLTQKFSNTLRSTGKKI